MTIKAKVDVEKVLAHLGAIRLAYSVDDLCDLLPLSRNFWYAKFNRNELRAAKAGEKTVVLLWDLVEFLNNLPTFDAADGREVRSRAASKLRAHRSDKNMAVVKEDE